MGRMIKRLDRMFGPSSVAIIGASATPGKIGNVLLRNFLDSRFGGKVHPVNPKYESILGFKCYPSVSDIPGRLDLAIIAIPAEKVPEVVGECARKKTGGVVILSGGFEEVERHDLAGEVRRIALESGMPIIGPNCLGIYNPYSKVDSVFLPPYKLERPKAGGIAFVTQSGAVGSTVMDLSSYSGIGISKFISYGNATVLDESDYLEYLKDDPNTSIIILYMEGVKDGRKLLRTMKEVNKVKPIIVLKGGKGAGGQHAAKSHTGNIAGSYLAYHSAFKQAKVTEADDIEEVFDFVKIFDQPMPKGNKVGVITNGGGIGVITADHIENEGLVLGTFSDENARRIGQILPEYGTVNNPLDLVADAGVDAYSKAIDVMMDEKDIDALIVIVLTQTPPIDERVIHILTKAVDAGKKPIATISIGGEYTEAYRKMLEKNRVPSYDSPRAAVRALSKMAKYARYCEKSCKAKR